jgi:hypothetical protein
MVHCLGRRGDTMAKRILVKVCTGGEPGEQAGCGSVVRFYAPRGRNVGVGEPANDCPNCGAPRYHDFLTQREIDRANGVY